VFGLWISSPGVLLICLEELYVFSLWVQVFRPVEEEALERGMQREAH